MSERKVLNKYYDPNFNPDKLPKNKRPKDKQDNGIVLQHLFLNLHYSQNDASDDNEM